MNRADSSLLKIGSGGRLERAAEDVAGGRELAQTMATPRNFNSCPGV